MNGTPRGFNLSDIAIAVGANSLSRALRGSVTDDVDLSVLEDLTHAPPTMYVKTLAATWESRVHDPEIKHYLAKSFNFYQKKCEELELQVDVTKHAEAASLYLKFMNATNWSDVWSAFERASGKEKTETPDWFSGWRLREQPSDRPAAPEPTPVAPEDKAMCVTVRMTFTKIIRDVMTTSNSETMLKQKSSSLRSSVAGETLRALWYLLGRSIQDPAIGPETVRALVDTIQNQFLSIQDNPQLRMLLGDAPASGGASAGAGASSAGAGASSAGAGASSAGAGASSERTS